MRRRPPLPERTIPVTLPDLTYEALLSLSVAVGKSPGAVVGSMLVASTPALVSLARVVPDHGAASIDRVGGLEKAIQRIITDLSSRDGTFAAVVASTGQVRLTWSHFETKKKGG